MARSEKMFVLGMDGMDPRLTKKYVDMGIMPNTKKFIEAGAQRDDLVLLGGHPTVTPSMWTTLSRGCYSNVHGITCFWRQSGIDGMSYNLDSRNCTAEAVWNCFAEAGKKTLVFNWPGSSWPPTSNNPNLSVVDGLAPGVVGVNVCQIDEEVMFKASEEIDKVTLIKGDASQAAAKCVINDLEVDQLKPMDATDITFADLSTHQELAVMHEPLIMSAEGSLAAAFDGGMPICQSPIKPASGWANAPEGAKEMTVLTSKGLVRRPALLLKNEQGIYDRVALYKTKKDTEPIAVIYEGKFTNQILDDVVKPDGSKLPSARAIKALEIDPEGKTVRMFITRAMSTENMRSVCQPQSLYDEFVKVAGYPAPQCNSGTHDREIVVDCMIDVWRQAGDYQAKCLNHCMNDLGYEVVFSHFHVIDLVEHNFIRFMSDKGLNVNPEEEYDLFMQENYKVADEYIGKYLHLLDEGWTVFIVSDHAQVCPKHNRAALGDMNGINVGVMKELGLTVLQKDADGNEIPKIDWSKTVAVAPRANQIYLNMKGRDPHGIVEPGDKYEWEEEIMTRLYGYKSPATGKRVVALALRNKDAVLLGMGGPQCGDIIYWTAEGYNDDHTDSLSTTWGEADTSVSPIFIAAGKGLKKGFTTDRIIREIDVTPTMAALGGVRMPKECEGAPVYQIFEDELIYN
mgnify:CR=1 FL=1